MSVDQLTPFGSALSGALGSIFANATVYPLDTVKTRLQALPPDERPSATAGEAEKGDVPPPKVGRAARGILGRIRRWEMLNMLLRIIKTEGLAGVFKGFSANMINTFSQQFAYFFFHTSLRTAALTRLRLSSLSTAQELLLGALAGALAQIFTIPVSVIALRQQISSSKSSKSLLDVGREIVAESGFTGLWTGLKPGLVLTVNPAITYGVFERVKALTLARHDPPAGRLSVGESFWIGVMSKTLATVVTYPYIFAKVRLQAQSRSSPRSTDANAGSYAEIASHEPAPDAPVVDPSLPTPLPSSATSTAAPAPAPTPAPALRDNGAIALLLRVYRSRGISGWYQGLGAQIIKAVLCQGILFVSKDQFESYTLVLLALLARLRARLVPSLAR